MINKNDGDFIIINTNNGIKKEAELVTKFTVEGFGDYAIYKVDGKLYGAKYKFDGLNSTLITDLNDDEKKLLNDMLYQLVK